MMRATRFARSVSVLGVAVVLSGCASFAEGVTRAMLSDRGEVPVDTRACEIEGPPFPGLLTALERQDGFAPLGQAGPERPILKVLMVHGIGTHEPGYAGTLETNLAQALELGVSAPQSKIFEVTRPDFPDGSLGVLRVSRHANEALTREMLFFELTWSKISRRAKAAIAFDDTDLHGRQRATMNRVAKGFVNDVAPDPLVYVGAGRAPILAAVGAAMCWMARGDWDELPSSGAVACDDRSAGNAERLLVDDLAFVTHSLGSRIMMDTLQGLPERFRAVEGSPITQSVLKSFRERNFPVFMLSNQLPLLQAGFAPPEVAGQVAEICRPGGPRSAERLWGQLDIVAFSDPNDLMSYPIPDAFVQNDIDSRLCPSVTNVTLNVAPVRSVLGTVDFANPLEAHSTYNADERVIALLARGLGQPDSDPVVTERCRWQRTSEALR